MAEPTPNADYSHKIIYILLLDMLPLPAGENINRDSFRTPTSWAEHSGAQNLLQQ